MSTEQMRESERADAIPEEGKLLLETFFLRRDVYAVQNRNGGARTVRRPITPDALTAHLAGKQRLGAYTTAADERVLFGCIDVDADSVPAGQTVRGAAQAIADALDQAKIPYLLEVSKSGDLHLWIFMAQPMEARPVRLLLQAITRDVHLPSVEVFPKQAQLDTPKKLGNLVFLPWHGGSVAEGRTVFLDTTGPNWTPYPDQVGALRDRPRLTQHALGAFLQERQINAEPTPPPGSGSPGVVSPRWLAMVQHYPAARELWQGTATTPPGQNPTPSAKDMRLGHFCRRHGFTPPEVRAILEQAPYNVGGGRTSDYLDRTVARIFAVVGTRTKSVSKNAFGKIFAFIISSGLWATLSAKAQAVYVVLAVWAAWPSGIARIGLGKLARLAGVSEDSTSKATGELTRVHLIRKTPGPMGVNYFVLPPDEIEKLTCAEKSSAQVRADSGADLLLATLPTSAPDTAEPTRAPTRRMTRHTPRQPETWGIPPHTPHQFMTRMTCPEENAESPPLTCPEESAVPSAAAVPSMRLDHQMLPGGAKRVYRVCSDGRRVLVWQGTIEESLSWTPPECLRYEERMAEWPRPDAMAPASSPNGSVAPATPEIPPLDAASRNGRCAAITTTRMECALRAVAGSRFCKRHQRRAVVR